MTKLAAYNFNEASGPVLDVTGNGRDWALNNNAIRTPSGHTGGGLTKNGTGMPVVASPSFIGTSAWTMMFWRQGLGDTVWWCRLYNLAVDTGSGILLLGGNLNVRIRTVGGSNIQASIAPPGDGLWHHYAATYDGANGRLYVDGILAATTASAPSPTANVDRIDISEHTLNNTIIDELQFFDVALSQAEIAAEKDNPPESGETVSLGLTLPLPSPALQTTSISSASLGIAMPTPNIAMQGSEVIPISASLGLFVPVPVLGEHADAPTGSLEMQMQRALTREFILSNPIDIALKPQIRQRKPSGGFALVDGAERPSQTFRLIPMSHTEQPRASTSAAVSSDSGIQRRYDYTLLGEWDSTMAVNDEWETEDGQRLVIENLVSYNGYERKGLVISYGRSPDHVE